MDDAITAGATSNVRRVKILDTALTGAGKINLLYNTAGLTCYYKRSNGTASVAVALVTITTLGTYVSGGFKEIDATNMDGEYEFHPPDAAFAAGAQYVTFRFRGASGMVPTSIVYPIKSFDLQTATQPVNLTQISADTTTLSKFKRGVDGTTLVTVGAGASTVSVITSSLSPAAVSTDQYKGLILAFDANTTTSALRGQKTQVTASTTGGVLSVLALSTAPISGDTGTLS